MEQIVQTFQLGTSTVVTLPKGLGIVPGQKFKVKKDRKGIVLKPKKEDAASIVDKLKGGMNFKKVFGRNLTSEDLNKLFDEQYKDVLPRR